MPCEFTLTTLSGIVQICPRVFADERGSFWECYKHSEFQANGITDNFVQDNHSVSHKNVIRGLHFQYPPHAQAKLVRCVAGEVLDVVVDIRIGSPTYGQWEAFNLSSENRQMLYVPIGFAHGFAALTDQAELSYKVSHEFHAPSEAGIAWNDPDLSIRWSTETPLVGKKDLDNPPLRDLPDFFKFHFPNT